MRIESGLVAINLNQQEQRRIVPVLVHVETQTISLLTLESRASVAQQTLLVLFDGVRPGAQVGGVEECHRAISE